MHSAERVADCRTIQNRSCACRQIGTAKLNGLNRDKYLQPFQRIQVFSGAWQHSEWLVGLLPLTTLLSGRDAGGEFPRL